MKRLIILLLFLFSFIEILNAGIHQMNIKMNDECLNNTAICSRQYFQDSRNWKYGISSDGLPAFKYSFSVDADLTPSIESISVSDNAEMIRIDYDDIAYFDQSTDAEASMPNYPSSYPEMELFNGIKASLEYNFSLDGQDHYNLFILPFIEDNYGNYNLCTDFKIIIGTSENSQNRALISIPNEIMHTLMTAVVNDNNNAEGKFGLSSNTACGFGDTPDYIVITDSTLAESFTPFILWKRELGYNAQIKLVEDIEAEYAGLDLAEKVREFLKSAYQDGLEWLLIGGDETVVPVRKLYSANTNEEVPDAYLHPSDLYYADLTGEWDVDGDGVWGEPYHDSPDLQPEIFVGRVPAYTPEEVSNWVSKSIAYEKGNLPEISNFAGKVLVTSADQMRDWNMGQGQDSLIAQYLPEYIGPDLTAMAEYPSGDDPTPSQPPANSFIQKYSEGWNLAVILAHGVREGFVSMSASYNEWPKTYVWIGEGTRSDKGYLDDLQNYGASGVIYSVACSQGAFDCPNDESRCFAEYILDLENRGAAAFIGYTRYGWVASSYKLGEDFVDALYNTDNRIGPANTISKLLNTSYRDLNYGINVFGDPSLRVWTDSPAEISVEHPQMITLGENDFSIHASSNGTGLENALVTVVTGDENLYMGTTGPDGILNLDFNTGLDSGVVLTVSANGYVPYQVNLATSIILDADDDNNEPLPESFELYQNYPNPANPTTTVGFNLKETGNISLELFNLLGQKVEFIERDNLPSGYNEIELNLAEYPSGVYFYRLTADDLSETRKLMLLK